MDRLKINRNLAAFNPPKGGLPRLSNHHQPRNALTPKGVSVSACRSRPATASNVETPPLGGETLLGRNYPNGPFRGRLFDFAEDFEADPYGV